MIRSEMVGKKAVKGNQGPDDNAESNAGKADEHGRPGFALVPEIKDDAGKREEQQVGNAPSPVDPETLNHEENDGDQDHKLSGQVAQDDNAQTGTGRGQRPKESPSGYSSAAMGYFAGRREITGVPGQQAD